MDINKILNLHQSYTQAQIKNLNKEILGAQYAQLGQLQALQMKSQGLMLPREKFLKFN